MAFALAATPSFAGPGDAGSREAQTATPLPPARPLDLPGAREAPAKPLDEPVPPASTSPGTPVQNPPTAASRASDDCLAALGAVAGTRVKPASIGAQADAACQVEQPVVVEALGLQGTPGTSVRLDPPPVLACAMARAVAHWLDASAAPLARGSFGVELTSLRVGGGLECRRRNRAATGPLSEHATGKALDIAGFRIGSGTDSREISVAAPRSAAESRFLEGIRQSACGAFATALGPGSDAAHADHLHVDIQQRRQAASRFCQ